MREFKEGKIKILIPEESERKSSEVFYNPNKKFDRDLSIFILKKLKVKGRALDLLSGSGVYGLRIASEGLFEEVVLNDKNPKAVGYIRRNYEINKDIISSKIEILNEDATRISGKIDGFFDYIDIDPFGSPIKFLPTALTLIKHKGIISVTATDTGALYGTYPKACLRKYGSVPLKTYESHEIGLRILIKRIAEISFIFDSGIEIIFSYWFRHIYRVFFRVLKGKNNANKNIEEISWIYFDNGWKFSKDPCKNCYGPIWRGKLWEKDLAKSIGENFDFLNSLKDEWKIDTKENIFYDIHGLGRRYSIGDLEKIEKVIEKIKEMGYNASRSIFSKTGVRTDSPFKILLSCIKKKP